MPNCHLPDNPRVVSSESLQAFLSLPPPLNAGTGYATASPKPADAISRARCIDVQETRAVGPATTGHASTT
jgi:hypothetical protein